MTPCELLNLGKRRCKMEETKPILELSGQDGNAFFILGRARTVAREAGWSDEKWKEIMTEATSGDYDHLLQTMMKYFDVI